MSIKMVKKHNKKLRISPSLVAFIGTLIILVGGFFLSYNYIQEKKVIAFDYMTNVFYNGQELVNISENEATTMKVENNLPETITNDYIGYLSIPKINLNKGFLDLRSKENDVDKNILVVQGSTYPDVENGNLILASHSGPSWNAYFNDLYKLKVDDLIYVSYKNKKYTYKIKNIYKQEKVGTIAIYRNYDKTTLTLVTCTNFDSKTQTVYISELTKIESE